MQINDSVLYYIWAQKVLGGTKALPKALAECGNAENLCNAVTEGREVKSLSRIKTGKLKSFSLSDAGDILNICNEKGWSVVTVADEIYPQLLKLIPDYPAVLFCDGNLSLLSSKHKCAVVGTRKPSLSARSTAYKTGLYLSSSGVTVVSGAAFGIDNCCHEGSIPGGSGTIAVLGCGLGSSYVNKIPFSYDRIKKDGLFVTEMFPYEKPTVYTFPKRNRIISGLCEATVVIECGADSGALITADLCKKQSRKLCCISDNILPSEGVRLLESQGSVTVEKTADIFPEGVPEKINSDFMYLPLKSDGLEGRVFLLEGAVTEEEYNGYAHAGKGEEQNYIKTLKHHKSKANGIPAYKSNEEAIPSVAVQEAKDKYIPDVQGLSVEERAVLSCISVNPVYPDEICDKTGLDITSVTVALTTLEIEGLIVLNAGNTVSLM